MLAATPNLSVLLGFAVFRIGRDSQTTKEPADRKGQKALTTSEEDDVEDGEEEKEQQEGEEEEEIIVLDTESLIIAMERVTVLFDRSVLCLFCSRAKNSK